MSDATQTPDASPPTLAAVLLARFGEKILAATENPGETTIEIGPGDWLAVAQALREEADFHFEQAVDLSGIDYLGYGQVEWETTKASWEGFSRGVQGAGPGRFQWSDRPRVAAGHGRFAAVVHLLSLRHNRRLRLRCRAPDDALPVLPSLTGIWPGLNWFEREAFDLYGIIFEGHPDLRRILTDYGFVGHPFRKDFPLIGNVEVRYDEALGRVVYEPVTSVAPRVGVPRMQRHDSRYAAAAAEKAAAAAK